MMPVTTQRSGAPLVTARSAERPDTAPIVVASGVGTGPIGERDVTARATANATAMIAKPVVRRVWPWTPKATSSATDATATVALPTRSSRR